LFTDSIQNEGVTNVFVLCEKRELERFGVVNLIEDLEDNEMNVTHIPVEYGMPPSIDQIMHLISTVFMLAERDQKSLIMFVKLLLIF